jgi:hypothetical protein
MDGSKWIEDAWVNDHVVGGNVVVPGAWTLEAFAAALRSMSGGTTSSTVTLENVSFVSMVSGIESEIEVVADDADGRVVGWSRDVSGGGDSRKGQWHEFARCDVARGRGRDLGAIGFQASDALDVKAGSWRTVSGSEMYNGLKEGGLEYGAGFQVVESVFVDGAGRGVVKVIVDGVSGDEHVGRDGYTVGPIVIDGCLQGSSVVIESMDEASQSKRRGAFVPSKVEEVRFYGGDSAIDGGNGNETTYDERVRAGDVLYGLIRVESVDDEEGVIVMRIEIVDGRGRQMVSLHGFEVRRLGGVVKGEEDASSVEKQLMYVAMAEARSQ